MVSPSRFLIVLEASLQHLIASICGYYAIGRKSQLCLDLWSYQVRVSCWFLSSRRLTEIFLDPSSTKVIVDRYSTLLEITPTTHSFKLLLFIQ